MIKLLDLDEKKLNKDIAEILKNSTKCLKCKNPLSEKTGLQKVTNGYMCDNCYYESFCDELDKRSIGKNKILRRFIG